MHEQSQIDEMRAAVRGDRERAEQARKRSQENVRALLTQPEPEPEPHGDSPGDSPPTAAPEPEPHGDSPQTPAPRRSFLSRLLGR